MGIFIIDNELPTYDSTRRPGAPTKDDDGKSLFTFLAGRRAESPLATKDKPSPKPSRTTPHSQ